MAMKFFDRLRQWLSFADNISDKAEDPIKVQEQAILDMEEDLLRIRQAVATVLATRGRIEAQYNRAIDNKNHWLHKAEDARELGNLPEAQSASEQYYYYRDKANALGTELDSQLSEIEAMKCNFVQLESEISKVKTEKDLAKAAAQAAKAQEQINNKLAEKDCSFLDALERMEKQVQSLEDKIINQRYQKEQVQKNRSIQEDLQETQQFLATAIKTQQTLEIQYDETLSQVKSCEADRNSVHFSEFLTRKQLLVEQCNIRRWHLHKHIIFVKHLENTYALLAAHDSATTGQKLLQRSYEQMLEISATPHLLQPKQLADLRAARQQLRQVLADTMTAKKMAEKSCGDAMNAANIWSRQTAKSMENVPLSCEMYEQAYTEAVTVFHSQVDKLNKCYSWQEKHLMGWERRIDVLPARWKN
jgi:phage shock protein A